MFNYLVRLALTALVFFYVFPHMIGLHFEGTLWPDAFVQSFLFGIVGWLVSYPLFAALALITVASIPLGMAMRLPSWLLPVVVGALGLFATFWMAPAIQLEVFAYFFPQHFQIASWGAAFLGGLVLMAVNIMTSVQTIVTTVGKVRETHSNLVAAALVSTKTGNNQ